MLKTVKMARISYPVGFSEEIIAIFKNEKGLKLTPKVTKKPKTFFFSKFYAIFVKFLTDFVD